MKVYRNIEGSLVGAEIDADSSIVKGWVLEMLRSTDVPLAVITRQIWTAM